MKLPVDDLLPSIVDALGTSKHLVIEAPPVFARDLHVLGTEPEFDPRLEPPEQVRREHHVSVFRPSIGDRADLPRSKTGGVAAAK